MININNNISVYKGNRYMLFYYIVLHYIMMIINPRSIYINIGISYIFTSNVLLIEFANKI